MMTPKIIFQTADILVIEKPAKVIVNRAETVKEETIQDWVERKLKTPAKGEARQRRQSSKLAKYKEFYNRSGIVHRLDKETSGLLVIAKTLNAFENLKLQFKNRQVKKRYLALVHGKMESSEGEISLPIKRLPWDREKFGVVLGGKKARTKYKLIENYFRRGQISSGKQIDQLPISYYSLLEVEPETGRTHQIRVHLKHLDHPLVGDLQYGGRRVKEDRLWCPRLFLHALFLSFKLPGSGKKIEIKSPLPDDLKEVLWGF